MREWTTLVDADTLSAALGRDDLVVVDARSSLADPEGAAQGYRDAHLPGAVHAVLARDLSGPHAPGAGRHPWPDAEAFSEWLGHAGIGPQHQVVVYDTGDGALAAARLWFLLQASGHRRVAVLDGGLERWNALGLPLESGTIQRTPTRYPVQFDTSRLLAADEVQAYLDAGNTLVDARAAERFRGDIEPIDRVAGHVPGAVNRPYAQNMRDGRFKPAEELAREFAALLGDARGSRVAVMCGAGVTACHHLLAMEHAGLRNARLFTGSWSGWIEDPSRPVAQGD